MFRAPRTTRFWFNLAYHGNDHYSFHSQNSCFRELRALENWDQQPELLFLCGGKGYDSAWCRATPPSLCTCCFLFSCRMASLRHPLFTWLMPSRFSRFFCCHLLQVLLNFLLHVSSTSTKLCPLLNQYFEFPSAVTLYTLVIVCFLARLSSLQFLSCLLAHKW